jgi:hypothetical protein
MSNPTQIRTGKSFKWLSQEIEGFAAQGATAEANYKRVLTATEVTY